MFRVKLTGRARKELKTLSKTNQISIGRIFEELKDDPFIGKPLARELIKKFSYRVGVYRIVYKINQSDEIILILTVGHRSTVYQ